jgi:signal transduction histidine kinase
VRLAGRVGRVPRAAQDEEWWLRWLPFLLLGLGVAIGTASAPLFDDHSPEKLVLTLGVAAGAAAWLAVWTFLVPVTTLSRRLAFAGRTVFAFVLTWLNPFYAVFAFIGYTDVADVFPRRWALWAALPTALTMAGSQSGGWPPEGRIQWAVFGGLFVLNAGLSTAFTRMYERERETSVAQVATIGELERVNRELEDALAENQRLHATVVTQARAAGVQEERQRLAREIHDTLAQSLAGIVTQLQAAGESPSVERVSRVTELARTALAEARRSVLDLAPSPLAEHAALPDAIAEVVSGWGRHHETKADLVVTGEPVRLHPEVEAAVVRIVQEALTNVAKHAAATRVGVTLTYDDEQLLLDVRDDGVGFDPATAPGPESFGLRAMRQRAARLAGSLEIESEPAQGATVTVRLPALREGAA